MNSPLSTKLGEVTGEIQTSDTFLIDSNVRYNTKQKNYYSTIVLYIGQSKLCSCSIDICHNSSMELLGLKLSEGTRICEEGS